MDAGPEEVTSRLRSTVVTLLVIAFALFSSARAHEGLTTPRPQARVPRDGGGVEDFGRRVEGLRDQLPESGIIGFLSDTGGASQEYVLLQYFAAPLIVQYGPEGQVVIGHYSDRERAERFLSRGDEWRIPESIPLLLLPSSDWARPRSGQK